MLIYRANYSDIDKWLELAEEFYEEGFDGYKWGFNRDHARITYTLFIQNHLCFMAELDGIAVGCLAGVITQHHFNYDFIYFQEAMWFIRKPYRGKGVATQLLKAVEEECGKLGCQKLSVGISQSVMPEKLDRVYRQMGFKLFETHYIKDIKWPKED
jgi:GNAT superfamily N-acetyltransferase